MMQWAATVIVAALYGLGVHRLWRRAGVGRGIERWRVASFAAGLVTLLLALASPLDGAAAHLFRAHMIQHMLLLLVAAPLLVLGLPGFAVLWAIPLAARRAVGSAWIRAGFLRGAWRSASRPAFALAVYVTALSLWHLPRAYEAALASDVVHVLEHVSFLTAALLFWWSLLELRTRLPNRGAAVLALFGASLHGNALGALITFSPSVLYPHYRSRSSALGLAPLEDQQVAGLIMWMPAGIVLALAAVGLLALWLAEPQASGRPRSALDGGWRP